MDRLPASLARKLPRYPSLPAILLGRLAVHTDAQGQKLGSYLLYDAFARVLPLDIGWAIFLVNAKDESLVPFYQQFDFQSFEDDHLHLFLTRHTMADMFS